MERVDRILRHPIFRQTLTELDELERERIFCHHGLEHLLSVARIMTIRAQETGSAISREMLYAAALLHDIGRVAQYRTGEPHETAGTEIASAILTDCGFTAQERTQILAAIAVHRGGGEGDDLAGLLCWADKASRPCWSCPAAADCNWPEEKRNHTLEY